MKTLYLQVIIIVFLLYSCVWFTKKPKEEKIEAPSYEDMLKIAGNYVDDGVTYFEHGEDSLAIRSWNKALEYNPGDAELHNWMGIAYFRMNKIDQAISHYTLAVNLDTLYYAAYNNLGYALFINKDYDAANDAYLRALSINSNFAKARTNYEQLHKIIDGEVSYKIFELTEEAEKIDDTDIMEKIEYYKKILVLDSSYARAHNNIGVAYYYAYDIDSSYIDSSFIHLYKAIKFDPGYAEALNNLGYLYRHAGNYEQAIKFFLKAVSLKQGYIYALNNLGETYYLNNEYENARRVFNTVLEFDSENPTAKEFIIRMEVKKESD
jgi:tetratricopeptide (TPR) repeat protein